MLDPGTTARTTQLELARGKTEWPPCVQVFQNRTTFCLFLLGEYLEVVSDRRRIFPETTQCKARVLKGELSWIPQIVL